MEWCIEQIFIALTLSRLSFLLFFLNTLNLDPRLFFSLLCFTTREESIESRLIQLFEDVIYRLEYFLVPFCFRFSLDKDVFPPFFRLVNQDWFRIMGTSLLEVYVPFIYLSFYSLILLDCAVKALPPLSENHFPLLSPPSCSLKMSWEVVPGNKYITYWRYCIFRGVYYFKHFCFS